MSDNDYVFEEIVIGEESSRQNVNKNQNDKSTNKLIKSSTSSYKYVQRSVIGNGAYGVVYLAKNVNSGKVVAMKKINLPNSGGIPMSTLREITMLKKIDRCDHPNIIKLLDVCHSYGNNELYLIYEHVQQDLATYLNNLPHSGLSEASIKSITHQIICGIEFLHSNCVLHRDIKPQNILISNKELIKLADFGLSKAYSENDRLTTVVVTLWYRAPEVLLNLEYSSPIDVWSIGCIMAEMYKLEPLFMGSSEGDQLDKIIRIIGSPDRSAWTSEVISYEQFAGRNKLSYKTIIPRLSDLANDFLNRMLDFDPSKRMTAKESLSHPYLRDSIYQVPMLNR